MEIHSKVKNSNSIFINSSIIKNNPITGIGARSIEHHPPDGVRGAPLLKEEHRLRRDEVAEGLAGLSRGEGGNPQQLRAFYP